LTIAEPMTVLTDYGLAAVSAALAARLWMRAEGQAARGWWAASFAAVALAAAAGGSWHGWAPRMARPSAEALWLATYVLVGLGNALILAGAVHAAARGSPGRALMAVVALRFVVWLAFMARQPDFRYVVHDYAGTLAGLLLFAAWLAWRRRPGAAWIAAGVGVSLAGAAVQRARLAPDPAFNHNDLFHVVQAAGLYLFYRGGRVLADAQRQPGHNGGRHPGGTS
jgi:hypothetical protein